jgi:hypothetical protein
MQRDDLIAFARRDWHALSRSRRDFWADRYRREGGGPARHAATQLLEHARRLGSALDDAGSRDRDFASHLRLRDRLDRATRALAGR